MTTIYERLQFPAGLENETIEYSNSTVHTLNSMPSMLDDWQKSDIGNNTASIASYYKNPVSANANTLITTVNQVSSATSGVPELDGIVTACSTAVTAINNFRNHADRISGVVQPNSTTSGLPHYKMAIGFGKVLAHIVYQSDGVTNNSVMIGSFGSLFKNDSINTMKDILTPYITIITDSLVVNVETELVESSNLASEVITTITDEVANVTTTLNNSRTSDVNFYNRSKEIIEEYNNVRGFTNSGETENFLLNNLIGSDKLLERINP